jgi:methionine biosynthesis protein MetW
MKHKEFVNKRYNRFIYKKEDTIRIKESISLIPFNCKVLDVGRGDGFISNLIKKEKKCKVFGLNLSFKSAKISSKKLLIVISDLEKELPFKDETFDVVYAGEIIEHIYDTIKFLKEINRVLKKDGILIITTPNLAGLGSRLRLLFGKKPWMIENWLDEHMAGHIRYFTFNDIDELLRKTGFTVTKKTSDIIKISKNMYFQYLARKFPQLGIHIIKAKKV